ncbi:MAG TPA: DUF6298 domain-containing protein [Bryobacteraceae bacterium]|nr:DUF6298 domain-containing protein [Bryobacteraceae bacterium]
MGLFCLTAAAVAQTPIDFSYAGYGGGAASVPNVPAVISVRPNGGDDSLLLQEALDHVAALPVKESGFRGAVLLRPGRYRVSGQLTMRAGGVVLRGSGNVTIVAAGNRRRTLIEIGSLAAPTTAAPIRVVDETVPAGGLVLTLEDVGSLHVGDRVQVTRPSTAEWIAAIKMRAFAGRFANQRLDWTPGSRNLVWDRTITRVDAAKKQITLDAPITTALERRYGGGTLARVESGAPVSHIGVENLTLDSEFDSANPRDEAHSWTAIELDGVEDAWVRGVTARHFADSAVHVGPRARRVTVEQCRSEQPVSEPGGYRRRSFLVEGQQVLVRQCLSEQGMNDFAAGLLAAGPNVFLDSTATGSLGPSGAFESWASGVLYENVRIEGSGISLTDDGSRSEGAGWTAANSVVWNCDAKDIEVRGPEGAENIVKRSAEPLYAAQLEKRTGIKLAKLEPVTVRESAPEFRPKKVRAATPPPSHSPVQIVNGRFVVDGTTLWGGAVNDGWWRGSPDPATSVASAGFALTRFVPGRTGPGLTEDLPALAESMVKNGTPFYQAIPGLWYDRRRDEHSIIDRPDANVWAPFYEMPWARSGQGTAADGLSKYDLSRFNPWYFERLREFGELCDRDGLVLYHNIYNTHNVLEIPPHWIDYPWRPFNNINNTGLPEPPPIVGGSHLHVANEVYDITNPVRRALHRDLILHELDELSGEHNLFFSLGFQFSGPLAFQEFFQDTVAEWEKKTGRTVRIELATSKDITDAILADPARARQVAVIDMQYWEYRPDGTLWAAPGGKNLAFREFITKDFPRSGGDTPGNTTPQQVYRLVREYHDRYPDKAIVAWNGGAGPIPVLMAGGAQALMRNPSGGHGQGLSVDRTTLDGFVHEHLATILMNMQPRDGVVAAPDQNWCLVDDHDQSVLLYSLEGSSITLQRDLAQDKYTGLWFDPRTGKTQSVTASVSGRAGSVIEKPTAEPWLMLLLANR